MASQDFPTELLPHDKIAEQAILGAIIIKNEVLPQVSETLSSSDFFSPAHQKIYQAILELSERGGPVDEVTLGTYLKDRSLLDQTGGVNYLVELGQSTPVVDNVVHYAQIVREKGRLRELITAANEIAKQGKESPENVEALIQQATETLTGIEAQGESRKSYEALEVILHEFLDELEQRSASPENVTGIPTGYTELDEMTHGLQNGDLIIIASRPSMGKTSLAMNIAVFAAIQVKIPVLVFSLEMPREHLAMRLLCSEGRVNSHKLQTGRLDNVDWDNLSLAAAKIMDAPMFIDDQGGITAMHVRNVARQVQTKYGEVGLILIDYLQLMQGASRTYSREQEISEISRTLKAIAKEFNAPVIALSQLNRDLERRTDKRPMMADLRESGAIEQDADIIMFIYRDEVYNEETEDQGIAEIIIAKHRNGEIGTKRLAFIGKYTKFANLSLRENP
ncbi:MAG: replicative DNA helicase [SAR324 cluster bacterium]|nr:replicative DNA helicase [SAR324 cluster bacterium]